MCRFVDAIKSLLDESDITTLVALANRLSPFRVDYRRVVVGDALSVKPILVLEHEQPPCDGAWRSAAHINLGLGAAQQQHHPVPTRAVHGAAVGGVQCDGLASPPVSNNVMSDGTVDGDDDDLGYDQDTLYNQGTDYENEGGAVGQDGLPAPDAGLFQECMFSHRSASTPRAGGHGESYCQEVAQSSHAITCRELLERCILPNFEINHLENCESSTSGGIHHCLPDEHSGMTGLARNTPSASPVENSITVELDGALEIATDVRTGKFNTLRAAKRHRRNTSSLRLSSHDAGCVGDARSSAGVVKSPARRSTAVSDAALRKVKYAARTCIRADYFQFLEANLPRWVRDGIWGKEWSPNQTANVDGYENLQKAYWHVCRLDRQMRDDAIRSRMAMVLLHLEYENTCLSWKTCAHSGKKPVTKVGRGNISSLIDNIIENTHPEWRTADPGERSELRAKFHDRKRYGKRWWMLVKPLGSSILMLCSSKFAGMIKNTTVTAAMINEIKLAIQRSETGLMSLLSLANPIAESLFLDQGYDGHNAEQVLKALRAARLEVAPGEGVA
uniref:Aurovertin biosynthesis cluster transcription factor aurF n=1 Tax=Calcarisporium arbuscula TaxID=240499 RepID=AURF_CALAK|nr:RecName: Full=Aurovertin biosynthesis cluster transcription factor aurF; AltName: Full=Aurovertin biosynthesis cluster protein F [Calcarisporium arbuscula]ALD83632.1 putative transcriptional factor [Calcarisporium arbuscula]